MEERKNLYFITFLQVIGPVFVILGHSLNGLPASEYLLIIKRFIYVFHMPLFFFISAYLFAHKGGLGKDNYKRHISKKFWRLMFPYIIWNAAFVLPKILLDRFLQDDMELSFKFFITIFLNPRSNILGHTWFLFALFEIYLLSPLWNYIIKSKSKIIWIISFLIAIAIRLLPEMTDILAINDLHKNILYFLMGLLFGTMPLQAFESKSNKKKFLIEIVLFITFFVLWITLKDWYTRTILCAITLLILFEFPIVFKIENKILNTLGKYSYTIYILHWPIMLGTRILLFQILNINYLIVAIVMIIMGYFVPIILAELWKKIKQTKKINSKIVYYLLGM